MSRWGDLPRSAWVAAAVAIGAVMLLAMVRTGDASMTNRISNNMPNNIIRVTACARTDILPYFSFAVTDQNAKSCHLMKLTRKAGVMNCTMDLVLDPKGVNFMVRPDGATASKSQWTFPWDGEDWCNAFNAD